MAFRKTIHREIEVAFSRRSQPSWFRILKYVVLTAVIYLFWGTRLLWIILLSLFVVAMLLHFWYRYKTDGWKKSYGMWKYHAKEDEEVDEK